MKKLLQALPFALVAVLAVLPAAVATPTVENNAPTQELMCGRCGDGYCSKTCGETATSCPKDCGTAY